MSSPVRAATSASVPKTFTARLSVSSSTRLPSGRFSQEMFSVEIVALVMSLNRMRRAARVTPLTFVQPSGRMMG